MYQNEQHKFEIEDMDFANIFAWCVVHVFIHFKNSYLPKNSVKFSFFIFNMLFSYLTLLKQNDGYRS